MSSAKWLGLAFLVITAFLILVVGLPSSDKKYMEIIPTTVTIKTLDGEDLAATLYAVPEAKSAVVFAHMMPSAKESWEDLAALFAENSITGLAIDLRGHGESTGGPRAYTKFSDEEHQKSILDIDAAVKFLLSKGFTADQIVCVGASIGANLCLKYVADHPDFKAAALLSAGLNYRGILAESSARELKSGARILIVSAQDDGENAKDAAALFDAIPDPVTKKIQIYETGGHGTDLLSSHKDLPKLLLEFVLAQP